MTQLGPEQVNRASRVLLGPACGDVAPLAGLVRAEAASGHPGAENFCRWRTEGATDIGNQTRSVLSRACHGEGRPSARLRRAARDYAATHAHAAGNGALMRTSIVGLTALRDRDATAANARAVAELTHADPLAGDSCVLWSEASRIAVLERRLDVISGLDLIPGARRDQWRGWLGQAETKPPSTFSPNGFTVTALQAAWAAIVQADPDHQHAGRAEHGLHLVDALQCAMRIADDTDTIAAIAGAARRILGPVRRP